MRFIKPLDEELLHVIFNKFSTIVTIEEGTIIGGFGNSILDFASRNNYNNKTIKQLGLPDEFIDHGKVDELFESVGLSKKHIKDILTTI